MRPGKKIRNHSTLQQVAHTVARQVGRAILGAVQHQGQVEPVIQAVLLSMWPKDIPISSLKRHAQENDCRVDLLRGHWRPSRCPSLAKLMGKGGVHSMAFSAVLRISRLMNTQHCA
jgi:hypothetical protein